MPESVDTRPSQRELSLEDELEHIQQDEQRFEQRVQRSQIALAVAAFAALIAAVAALTVALANKSTETTYVMRGDRAGAAQAPAGMPGGAMAGGGGSAMAPGAAAARTVDVQLGEMFVRPGVASISAGKVTFVARNTGGLIHELMIERAPLKMDGPGRPTESAAQGMIKDMQPGQRGRMTLRLRPGTYVLFCNVTGHYAAGQHTPFTVTRG